MKLSIPSFTLLGLGLLFAACSDQEGLPFEEGQQYEEKEVLTWRVQLLSQGSSPSINADAADNEDKVSNIVLAGSATNSYSGGTSATFGVPRFFGKKNFFFAANLIPYDQAAVGAGHTETDFNNFVLHTYNYLRTPFGTNDEKAGIPMTATLRDVQVDASGNFKMFDKKDQLVDAGQVQLTRAYAKVELEMVNPGNFPVDTVFICNIPQKFALAAPIQNYNTTTHGYMSVCLYDKNVDGNALAQEGTPGTIKKTFYVPELTVSAPTFHEQGDRGMMYVVVYHHITGKTGLFATAYRIADPTLSSPNYGKVLRNHVYKLKVQGSDAKRTAIPPSSKTPVVYFAN